MITACSHCGSKYELPDKMLGRQARCKACSKMFLICFVDEGPASTARPEPDKPDDPLDALASAAAGDAPPPPRSTSRQPAARSYDANDQERPARPRKARGAGAAMGTGIAALIAAVAAGVCGLITMLSGDNQALVTTLGPTAIGLAATATALAMAAVVNGTSAARRIRRARHPLAGRSQASTGSITGAIALLLVVALTLTGSIWLINRGGLNFEQVVTEGNA